MYTLNIYRGSLLTASSSQAVTNTWQNVLDVTGSGVLLSVKFHCSRVQGDCEVVLDGNAINVYPIANPANFFLVVDTDTTIVIPFNFANSGVQQKIEFKTSLYIRQRTPIEQVETKVNYILDT